MIDRSEQNLLDVDAKLDRAVQSFGAVVILLFLLVAGLVYDNYTLHHQLEQLSPDNRPCTNTHP